MIRVTTLKPDSVLRTGQVADLLGVSRRTVLRWPRTDLDYWQTPDSGYRRYALAEVVRYARERMGLTIEVAQG